MLVSNLYVREEPYQAYSVDGSTSPELLCRAAVAPESGFGLPLNFRQRFFLFGFLAFFLDLSQTI